MDERWGKHEGGTPRGYMGPSPVACELCTVGSATHISSTKPKSEAIPRPLILGMATLLATIESDHPPTFTHQGIELAIFPSPLSP